MRTGTGIGVLLAAVCAAVSFADDAARSALRHDIGLREPFDTAEGWVAGQAPGRPDERYAPKAMKVEDGKLVVQTQVGVLSGFPDSVFLARKIVPLPGISRISKKYGEVDLDKFHFVVVQMSVAQGCANLNINNKQTKVLYTTGLHAQDISDIPELRGRREVTLELVFFNGAGRVVMDDIRLVSRLTEEERKALIPRGFEVREQKLKAGPYQGLEALYERGRAPLWELLKSEAAAGGPGLGEWAVFHDQATGAPIIKLTRYTGSDSGMQLSANGRWLLFRNSLRPGFHSHVVDLRTRKILPLPPGEHEFYPKDGDKTALVGVERKGEGGRFTAQECDLRTMKVRTVVEKEVPSLPAANTEFCFSDESNRFAFGYREHDFAFLVDPDAKEAGRFRLVKLPYPIKGLSFANQDRFFGFANCFTYQMIYYDYGEKKTHVRCQRFAGGHNARGGGMIFGPYGSVLKLIAPEFDMSETPGDAVRIHSNYHNSRIEVDYGTVSPDGRWAFQDGTRGDVDRQIVGFDLNEGGNVMPIFFHNTSSVGWDVKPYVRVSPDSTKIVLFSCDMLGDGDVLLVPFQRPDPPREIAAREAEMGLVVSWKPAERSAETRGYNVYRSAGRAGGFRRLNDTPMVETKFSDIGASPKGAYLVTAVDNSGLESRLPAPVWLGDRPRDDAVNVFLEAECADVITLPFRRQYDGYAGNFSVMRLMPETPQETEGGLTFRVSSRLLHAEGRRKYGVGLRCRLRSDIYPETREAALKVAVDGKPLGGVAVSGKGGFEWRFLKTDAELAPGDHELTVRSASPGVEVDRVALSSADADRAWAADAQNPEPELQHKFIERADGVAAKADGPFAVKLTWPETKDAAHYSVYASSKPEVELSNETLVGSTDAARFRDAGLRPGADVRYRVVGHDMRGRRVVSYAGKTRTEPLAKTAEIRLSPKAAALGGALELAKEESREFIRAKASGQPQGKEGAIRFGFNAPATGDYAVWFYNRPNGENRYMNFRLDQTVGGTWGERFMLPGQRVEMLMQADKKRSAWYVSRLALRLPSPRDAAGVPGARGEAQDVFRLKAGPHELELTLVQDKRSAPCDIGEILLTNDLTWYPKDYDPRAQFRLDK